MKVRMAGAAGLVLLTLATGACDTHEFQPPPAEERVQLADSLYSPALFDTVTWDSPAARIEAGNLVYADECRRCHGTVGRGETEYARERGLEVPSLVRPGWVLADDIEAVRRRVFIGHVAGMPSWGLARLTPRQIDAAASYILDQLRPEILGDTAARPGAARPAPIR